MTTRLPAWVAICAVLTVQAGPVWAADPPDGLPERPTDSEAPRHVAVIDLSEDDEVRTLSGELYKAINASDVLKVPDIRGLDMFLVGKFFDEDAEHIVTAHNSLTTANSVLNDPNAPAALTQARNGEAELAKVVPTTYVRSLYADLSLVAGLALLDEGKSAEAANAFALTHRLDPSRKLDEVRYPPDTVTAYRKAIEATRKRVKVEINGSGHVWIDCVDRGEAPLVLDDIEVGDHVITVTGSDRLTTPIMPMLVVPAAANSEPKPDKPGKPKTDEKPEPPLTQITAAAKFEVPENKADDVLKVQRARFALARAQRSSDTVARAGAMKELVTLLHATDAVMISKAPDGGLQWETWRDRAPGFSAPKAYHGQTPDEILAGLGPIHSRLALRASALPPFTPPALPEQPWYKQGWGQISIGGGVILAIAVSILISTREHAINFNPDVKSQ